MEWILANWLWILFGIAFVGMHLFMHGGHGGHGDRVEEEAGKGKPGGPKTAPPAGHQH